MSPYYFYITTYHDLKVSNLSYFVLAFLFFKMVMYFSEIHYHTKF